THEPHKIPTSAFDTDRKKLAYCRKAIFFVKKTSLKAGKSTTDAQVQLLPRVHRYGLQFIRPAQFAHSLKSIPTTKPNNPPLDLQMPRSSPFSISDSPPP
ncbi:sine oculis-binding protein, partial [Trichinella spiralis]|uniref:sine oculis-binding protein n=1 Tax=Trichinella spiralis TaxID=6334 RepID=UPI0001EFD635